MTPFSINLKEYRKKLHLSQEQLARKIKRKRTIVADWENDKYKPKTEEFIRICGVLKIVDPLLFFTDMNYITPQVKTA